MSGQRFAIAFLLSLVILFIAAFVFVLWTMMNSGVDLRDPLSMILYCGGVFLILAATVAALAIVWVWVLRP
jgi:hypothetical protein